jgi:hypothetical protein
MVSMDKVLLSHIQAVYAVNLEYSVKGEGSVMETG